MNQTKIYLDTIVFRIQTFGGASTYWKELLVNYSKLNNINLVIQDDDTNKLNHDGKSVIDSYRNNRLIVENKLPVGLLRYMPFTKRLPPASLYHASYYRVSFQRDIANIFTVHDFTHKRGYASRFPRKLVHIGLTAIGLKRADGIICISENTKKDLLHFYPEIEENKVKVIYHGVSDDFHPLQKNSGYKFRDITDLNESYALFVGKRGGYKKFDLVPEAIKRNTDLKLFIIGGGPLSAAELELLENNLPGRYVKLDNVNNSELNILYNYAHSLIYTSIYEGFGIPLLEAMKAGCPVVTNQLSSLGEISGDAALFIDQINSEELAKKLSALADINLRKTLISKGFDQSAKFTWDKCAADTYNFYKEIYYKRFSKHLDDL
ncbi:glycosyltransferase family 4 protein [Mucilaginibacter sp. JRF]|uniref:glycosyltransferase family 4 protein n=1 Tax=Mucilaginibacter sp. JRF TaxID=2780088 RepID=UPI00188065AE|nr:glycosyltransferase family 1 protein [Mucilaginibacter sp. JRF]MBE9585158.1 glycosyltransferase family 4 protein [Mucilaginibacter sp. JRF]